MGTEMLVCLYHQGYGLGYTAAVVSSIGMGAGLKRVFFNMTKNLKGGNLTLANCLISYVAGSNSRVPELTMHENGRTGKGYHDTG